MSYVTYTTEAIVCGSRDSYTSDRSYLLFSESAGMVWATARSVREERSKQRTALQPFSLVRVSLVRGKSGWRIGSVEGTYNAYFAADSQPARAGVVQVVKLLRRLVHGESVVAGAYADARDVLRHIAVSDPDLIAHTVDHFTLRALAELGYIAVEASFQDLVTNDAWLDAVIELPAPAKRAIEKGLEASHL